MALEIINPYPRYSKVYLIEPAPLGYLHLAADVQAQHRPGPVLRRAGRSCSYSGTQVAGQQLARTTLIDRSVEVGPVEDVGGVFTPHALAHDVGDDDGHGWTLLRHAINVEHDAHVQTGKPLHADVTAFLLARGADPLRPFNGVSVIAEAETRGHWLAAEIMRAWTGRGSQPAGQEEGTR